MFSTLLVIALLVIIAFVVGVAFLFRGYRQLPDPRETAPADLLEKVQSELKTANIETENLRSQSNTLAIQLDEMKGKVSWAEGNVKSLEDTLRKSSQAYTRIDQLEKDLQFLSQKADSQAREAIDVITRLAAEAETFRSQAAATVSSDDLDVVQDENQKLRIQVEGYASKVRDLETASAAALQAGEKYADVSAANARMVEENALLKRNLVELEEKIKTAQADSEQFKLQHAKVVEDLQSKLIEMETQLQKTAEIPRPVIDTAAIEEELRRVRAQSEEKILQASAALVKLNADVELLTAQIAEKDGRLKKLTDDLFSTREELAVSLRAVQDIKQASVMAVAPAGPDHEKVDLQKNLDEVRVLNQRLSEKEKLLTFKLAQSRAQVISLERLCDELKEQSEREMRLGS